MPSDSVIPLLGIHPKEYKWGYNGDTWTQMFIAKLWKKPKCSSTQNGWRKCDIDIDIDRHNGVLFSQKEEWNYVVWR
jgi:hypothetical protein